MRVRPLRCCVCQRGFWGQDLFVGGVGGNVYSLLSDARTLINTRFVQLSAEDIRCPATSPETYDPLGTPCTAETGTHMGDLLVKTSSGHVVTLVAGAADEGFSSVTVNGAELSVDETRGRESKRLSPSLRALLPRDADSELEAAFSVHRLEARKVRIVAGLYELTVHNMDAYLDVAQLRARSWSAMVERAQPEGILGMTWNATASLAMSEAEVDEYRERDGQLLGCNFARQKHCSAVATL